MDLKAHHNHPRGTLEAPTISSKDIHKNTNKRNVGTKGVSQVYHLGFDDNKVLKIINWILLKVYSSVQDHYQRFVYKRF